ncbi:MAG: FAD-dependent monooxygenase [Burkholderiales bacterium]
MKTEYDIIVVGGGLVGGAFALDLAQQNPKFKIAVLEKQPFKALPHAQIDNKIYAISPQNIAYLKKIGVWPSEERIGTINKMDIFGDQGGNILLDCKVVPQLFLAKTIEYNQLQHQIYTQLQKTVNITFLYDVIEAITQQECHVTLRGKTTAYTTTLLVGADGANSLVRHKALITPKLIDYGQAGIVANFNCEFAHHNTAYQWFNNGDILAYLPLPNKQISIVWSTTNYAERLALSELEFSRQVAKAGNYQLGELELITQPVAFPLRLYALAKIYAPHIALIGDAAHTIHPLAGQGVNLGFEDAALLADILASRQAYQLGDTALLAKYNQLRLPKIRQMQLICHSLQRLFSANSTIVEKVRNIGLNLVNTSSVIKKYLIKNV